MNSSNAFKRNVKADLTRIGATYAQVAAKIGIHVNTFRRHLDDPDLLTRRDMSILSGYIRRETLLMICPWFKEEDR